MFNNGNNMLRGATPAPRPNSLSPNQAQAALALESLWRSYWPFVSASIIAFFMLLFGLAVAALEAAGLELGSQIETTSVSIPTSSSISRSSSSLKIGVGIWSGAIIAVAAIAIFIISEFSFFCLFISWTIMFPLILSPRLCSQRQALGAHRNRSCRLCCHFFGHKFFSQCQISSTSGRLRWIQFQRVYCK
jgi:hypothetical protein